jgi:hypothetical protein
MITSYLSLAGREVRGREGGVCKRPGFALGRARRASPATTLPPPRAPRPAASASARPQRARCAAAPSFLPASVPPGPPPAAHLTSLGRALKNDAPAQPEPSTTTRGRVCCGVLSIDAYTLMSWTLGCGGGGRGRASAARGREWAGAAAAARRARAPRPPLGAPPPPAAPTAPPGTGPNATESSFSGDRAGAAPEARRAVLRGPNRGRANAPRARSPRPAPRDRPGTAPRWHGRQIRCAARAAAAGAPPRRGGTRRPRPRAAPRPRPAARGWRGPVRSCRAPAPCCRAPWVSVPSVGSPLVKGSYRRTRAGGKGARGGRETYAGAGGRGAGKGRRGGRRRRRRGCAAAARGAPVGRGDNPGRAAGAPCSRGGRGEGRRVWGRLRAGAGRAWWG